MASNVVIISTTSLLFLVREANTLYTIAHAIIIPQKERMLNEEMEILRSYYQKKGQRQDE